MLKFSLLVITTTILLSLGNSFSLAATKKPKQPDKFPPNPLEIFVPDPLLPYSANQQPLTTKQRQNLQAALGQLNQQAAIQLQAGNKQEAFDIWNRELRLSRYLGVLTEIQYLSRVGAIAWRENDRKEVQYITQRLQSIQKQTQNTGNLDILQALAPAYQEVRSPQQAVAIYNQLLAIDAQKKDIPAQIQTLQSIANLQLSWLNYPQAAAAYEELLKLSASTGDSTNEISYLQQLAYIFQQAQQPQQAVIIFNRLANIYTQQNNLVELPVLRMEIGSDYETLAKQNPNLLKEAFNNYQQAYTTAWELQQYVRAGEALQKLITLYRSTGQIDAALQVSEILVQAEQLAANSYGLMNAYDEIGQINLERKNYPQALAAFQKGLQIAQQLNYNQNYFTQQIQKLGVRS